MCVWKCKCVKIKNRILTLRSTIVVVFATLEPPFACCLASNAGCFGQLLSPDWDDLPFALSNIPKELGWTEPSDLVFDRYGGTWHIGTLEPWRNQLLCARVWHRVPAWRRVGQVCVCSLSFVANNPGPCPVDLYRDLRTSREDALCGGWWTYVSTWPALSPPDGELPRWFHVGVAELQPDVKWMCETVNVCL